MKKIRIGSGAGYAGDRIEPAVELMEKGNLDYIIFECLAERTIALGQQEKLQDPEKGYNPLLVARMERILPLAKAHHIKVITNMGAANPKAAAEMTAKIAKRLNVTGLQISYVLGDDLWEKLEDYYEKDVLENSKKLGEMKNSLISANVYMGAEGIIEALKQGADIIITGRVSDPALTIAPLRYEFGWSIETHPDEMGQAVLAGHLLECAGQVTGGYYADPGYKEVPDLYKLGFPMIEIDETGAFIVTKVDGSGGLVSVETCKEQLIYEIHNPAAYLTPDAIADFTQVTFTQVAENVVLAKRGTTHGKPETLKVSVGYQDCFIGGGEISYGGSNCMARAKLAAEIVEKRLEIVGVKVEELRVDFIGYNSLYKETISSGMTGYPTAEVRLRIVGRTADRLQAQLIANEVESLYTNGPAGGGGATKQVTEIVSVCAIFIPREDVQVQVIFIAP